VRKHPRVSFPLIFSEEPNKQAACNKQPVVLDNFQKEFSELKVNLTKISEELKKHSDKDENDRFFRTFSPFVTRAKANIDSLESTANSTKELFEIAVRFFGEQPANYTPEDFFGLITQFIDSFKV